MQSLTYQSMTFEDTLEQVNTKLAQNVEQLNGARRGRGRKPLTDVEVNKLRLTALGQSTFSFTEYLQTSNPLAPGLFVTKVKKGFRPSQTDLKLLENLGSNWDGVRDFLSQYPGLFVH